MNWNKFTTTPTRRRYQDAGTLTTPTRRRYLDNINKTPVPWWFWCQARWRPSSWLQGRQETRLQSATRWELAVRARRYAAPACASLPCTTPRPWHTFTTHFWPWPRYTETSLPVVKMRPVVVTPGELMKTNHYTDVTHKMFHWNKLQRKDMSASSLHVRKENIAVHKHTSPLRE